MHETREQPGDEELARRARDGDRACFDVLVERYGARLVAFLRTVTGSEQDALDLAQQGFVQAFQRLDRYDPRRPFRPWLFTVARRLAIDQSRRRRVETAEPGPEPVDPRHPAEMLARRETRDVLWDWTRSRLCADQFAAFRLRVEEEWSVREIATALGLGTTHVRVLLYRARRKLADALESPAYAKSATDGGNRMDEAPALLRAARQGKGCCP